ncbi:hypothetical protein Ae505Ps2_2902 [Pseudonocardia sp. Ae505_Ps2]|nr:hypothetical protein Ae505Ps2_2902 [Pseudonocardia sp. Ae505_Ps2]
MGLDRTRGADLLWLALARVVAPSIRAAAADAAGVTRAGPESTGPPEGP